MPNWCNNTLNVIGPSDKVNEFKEKAKGQIEEYDEVIQSPLSFESLFPTPKEFLEDKGVNPKWYSWRIEMWGTKWDATCVDVYDLDVLSYPFQTAWAPPLKFLVNISPMFPELTFELNYYEPGMYFEGEFAIKNGHIIKDESRDMVEGEIK